MTSYETDEPKPDPRECATIGCNCQALSNSRFCADCSDEIEALWRDGYRAVASGDGEPEPRK